MAEHAVPHLANDIGAGRVRVGVKVFKCLGARPPHDHPHVFLDMGGEAQTICPYCSTVFEYDPALTAEQSEPPGCVVHLPDMAWRGRAPGRGRETVV